MHNQAKVYVTLYKLYGSVFYDESTYKWEKWINISADFSHWNNDADRGK